VPDAPVGAGTLKGARDLGGELGRGALLGVPGVGDVDHGRGLALLDAVPESDYLGRDPPEIADAIVGRLPA
jgi:hypothetical protein